MAYNSDFRKEDLFDLSLVNISTSNNVPKNTPAIFALKHYSLILTLQKVFVRLTLSSVLFENILTFVWLVFQNENEWIEHIKFCFLEKCTAGCDVSHKWLDLIC